MEDNWTFAPSGMSIPENIFDVNEGYDKHYPPIKCVVCGEDIELYRTTYSQFDSSWSISIGYVRLPNAINSADRFRCSKCYSKGLAEGQG
jgi:GTPase SAR1 family protein